MPAMEQAPIVAVVVVLIFAGASFFFALAETALFSLSKWQARQLAEGTPRNGGIVMRLLAKPQDLLATMVLGNTFASAAMLAVALWMALRDLWPFAVTIAGLLALILIGGEVLPKTMAVRKPEQWALRVARPLSFIVSFSLPLCRVAQKLNALILKVIIPRTFRPHTALTDADYQELLEMAFQHGTLAQSEKEIILQIISLDRRTVKEVMKPRSQMAAIPDDLSIEEMAAAYVEDPDVARRHADQWPAVIAMAAKGINSPLTSSAGRLFDAAAAILGVRDTINYEGQAAIELEQLADLAEAEAYPAGLETGEGPFTIRGSDLLHAVVEDRTGGVPAPVIASRFHHGVAALIEAGCVLMRERYDLGTVALSGGVFQNLLLLNATVARLEARGFRVLLHSRVPCNDGGISLGQALVAASKAAASRS